MKTQGIKKTEELLLYHTPYLIQLGANKKGYIEAKYYLSQVATTRFSVPLYELLLSWSGIPGEIKLKKLEAVTVVL